MSKVLVRHKVADFNKWKDGYNANATLREQAGLQEKELMQNANDPNEVVILFEAQDRARAEAFTNSAGLKEVMEKAGVVGKPEIIFLN